MIKLSTKIENIEKEWEKIQVPSFISIEFLKGYYKKNQKLKHLFFMEERMRLYAHIFNLTFSKTEKYLKNNFFANFFLRYVNFDVLYLTNSFITNIPSFISDKLISLRQLLNTIEDKYSIIVIPDFLYKKMQVEDKYYTKIEVEEEMVLDIHNNWHSFEDYISDLRKKYRNKVKKIVRLTNQLEIRVLDAKNIDDYYIEMQNLFNQVVQSSSFMGPEFNVNSFAFFVKKDLMKVNGYFLNNKLIAFSSEIIDDKILYSYYVGFDKKLNKTFPIYGRILIDNIVNAIALKKDKLILGRTANEYKSNFGAYPNKSYVYLKIRNKYLRILLWPIYSKLSIKKWQQRHPLKNN